MKKLAYNLLLLPVFIGFIACDNNDVNVFDKTADERAAEAIANLKADLVAPPNGWKMKYKPVDEAGSYYVLMDFNDDNKVTIKTDLGANNGEFFEQTISYRIDNSLGLELIFENYSFFSYLFELDQATFQAEYEFKYANKTPDNELVFSSKSDLSDPTTLLFQEASAADQLLLGTQVALNLNTLGQDLDRFSSSLKLTYLNKDVIFYVSLDEQKRVITFNVAARKSNLQINQNLNVATGYHLQGNSLVLEQPVSSSVAGSTVTIESLNFSTLGDASISICAEPFAVHTYSGVTSSNDPFVLETTMLDLAGATFATASNVYFSPLSYIRDNGELLIDSIQKDITGAIEMRLYYGLALNDGSTLYGIGFVLQNTDGSVTFALREFTPALNQNNLIFNFAPDITLFGNANPDADISNINKYLDPLAEGNNTYVFKFSERLYEFHNPCTGWSIVFIQPSQ